MKFARIVLPLAMLAGGCFGQDVRYNFDKSAVFERYKTYKWVNIKDGNPLDQITDQQLRSAFTTELAKKGLTEVTGDNADLWIGYQATVGQEKQFNTYSSDFGYGPGWGGRWYGGGMGSSISNTTTSTIHVGEVVLDMYDPAHKQLVWRGTATKTLDPKAKPDKRQKNMAKGAAKLLKNYPPPPAKG